MSDKKITDLPITTSINPADISILVDNGIDYQFAFSTLLGFIGTNLNLGAISPSAEHSPIRNKASQSIYRIETLRKASKKCDYKTDTLPMARHKVYAL